MGEQIKVVVGAVKIPMMPKGVEHYARAAAAAPDDEQVKIPMMPKGVEHTASSRCCPSVRIVKIPMMPKGVEHMSRGSVS